MARAVRLDTLRNDCRLYADQRPGGASAFISDTELTRLVNQEIRQLYDRLVHARGQDHYLDEATITTVAGTATYALDADLMQMVWMGINWGAGNVEEISTWQHGEYADYQNYQYWTQGSPKGYRMRGTSTVEFVPTPTSVVTIDYRFVPAFTDLVNDSDTFDGINGWEKAVTLPVAMEMRAIADQGFDDLGRLYERVSQRIDEMAPGLTNEPKRIQDVSGRGTRRGVPLPRGKVWL